MSFFFFQAEDGIRDLYVTGVQTCALPICDQADPAANFALSQDGKRVPHGMNFGGEAESSGVEITQQTVAQRCLALDQIFYVTHVQLRLRNRRQHAQIIEPVGGNLARGKYFRTAEKVSLEVKKAGFLAGDKLFARFDFFCQQPAAPWS